MKLGIIFLFNLVVLFSKTNSNSNNSVLMNNQSSYYSPASFKSDNSSLLTEGCDENCGGNGKCFNSSVCICNDYFISFKLSINHQCNYIQLSKRTAFLLSLFLGPIGIEHIYRGNHVNGILKLIIPLISLIIGTFLFIVGKRLSQEKLMVIGKIIETSVTIIIILWWIIDCILFLCSIYKDENGVSFFDDM